MQLKRVNEMLTNRHTSLFSVLLNLINRTQCFTNTKLLCFRNFNDQLVNVQAISNFPNHLFIFNDKNKFIAFPLVFP